MSNGNGITVSGGMTVFSGEQATSLFRLMTLARGLKMEIMGMRMTRGRTCYAVIKAEFGLKGSKEKVLAQFLPLVAKAKAAVPITVEQATT